MAHAGGRLDEQRSVNPGRDLVVALLVLGVALTALELSGAEDFPTLNVILDTGALLLAGVLTFLLWDMGWRTGQVMARLGAVVFGAYALMELLHVFTALDVSTGPDILVGLSAGLRLGTFAPAAYLLPLGLLAALLLEKRAVRLAAFGIGLVALGAALILVQQRLPSYTTPESFGITRPTFLPLPALWALVFYGLFRRRGRDRLSGRFALFAALMAAVPVFMLFSEATASSAAMAAHFAKVIAELFLLLGLMQLGTMDTARRMRAEQDLLHSNEVLESRVAARTAELQQACEELRRTQAAVLDQERLRALGQMASGVAHDINNAISPVSLYVEALLTHESGLSARARGQLEVAQRAVDDVAHTVKRLGEFYRKKPSQLALVPLDVPRVLRDVLDLTRARWSDMAQQRGVVIDARIDAAPDAPRVRGVESELREALVNLVLNATDAMPEGGTLTLRWAHAHVEVGDTGVGMDEETRRRCLEPFFTTKGERGSGLGLAMVYGVAQRQGLGISICTAPGRGTTFRLTFPPESLLHGELAAGAC